MHFSFLAFQYSLLTCFSSSWPDVGFSFSCVESSIFSVKFNMKQTLTCDNCADASEKTIVFHHLELPLVKHGALSDVIDHYFEPDPVEYHCANCDGKRSTRREHMLPAPRFLVLNLKRDENDKVSSDLIC